MALVALVGAAINIPALSNGSHVLVSVEPLLRSLQLPYTIVGNRLQVDGRAYPEPLVAHGAMEMADAVDFAHFLHLDLSTQNGVLVFSSPERSPNGFASTPPAKPDVDALRNELLGVLNTHRQEAGLDALTIDPIAEQAAQYQADDMLRSDAMRHTDSTGRSPIDRYMALGGTGRWYGENVGWYGLDVLTQPALWSAVSKLDSEMMAERPPDDGHRKNILATQFNAVGIGVSVGTNGLFLAEDFVGK